MYKLWTLTLFAFFSASSLGLAQISVLDFERSKHQEITQKNRADQKVLLQPKSMNQNEWKNVLKGIKAGESQSPVPNPQQGQGAFRIQGPGTSGGGNENNAEFTYMARQIFADFKAKGIVDRNLELAQKVLEMVIQEKAYKFTLDKIILDGDEKTALNDYDVFFILLNEQRWGDANFDQKRLIIVHELLGLCRKFDLSIDDSKHQITNDLFAKLAESNEKNFLLKADYPKNFLPVIRKNISWKTNTAASFVDRGQKQNCEFTGTQPTVFVQIKSTANNKLLISFQIQCALPGGEVFSHAEGKDAEDEVEVISGNLLRMKNDFGSFIVGWISGEEMFIRSPAMTLSVRKKKDGDFDFRFEFSRGQTAEVVQATVKN